MRRILLGTVLAVGGLLATSAVASADIGDIDNFEIDANRGTSGNVVAAGTADFAQVAGEITCTTTIEYGLVVKVAQNPPTAATDESGEGGNTDAEVEGVGAYGPNQGNEANSPCSSSTQDWEVIVQRNRDSGTYQQTTSASTFMGVFALAGTSAEDGGRGPGPFIGDSEYDTETGAFGRVDP
jgi:hypothetical protein